MVTLGIYLEDRSERVADGLDVGCEKEELNLISRGMIKASERMELPLAHIIKRTRKAGLGTRKAGLGRTSGTGFGCDE